jgi:hypothetical protein
VEKVQSQKPAPLPQQFVDTGSGATDSTPTPGSIGTLNGARLKFDPLQADEGLYLLPTSGGASVKVTIIQRNKPSQLVFLNPTCLAAGDYFMEVRARTRSAAELRSGRLDSALTVL